MSAAELHEALRCFSLDVPPEQCADIIRDFMRDHKDAESGGLDHAQFVRFVLEIDNPDEFTHIGAGSMLSRGLRLTHNDDEKHLARVAQLKLLRERKNADAAGDIAVLVRACRNDPNGIEKMERAMRLKDVGRSGSINLKHFIDILTQIFGGDVTVTNARRLAGIFDENMVGYVSYELLLDKIRQQLTLPLDATAPTAVSVAKNIEAIKADHAGDRRMREMWEKIKQKIKSKLRNGDAEFRKAFELLDRDGSGCIAFDEWTHVVGKLLALEVPADVAQKLFSAIDGNHNGDICCF
jgi:Ca2+-binding EF-hand superfamily protein